MSSDMKDEYLNSKLQDLARRGINAEALGEADEIDKIYNEIMDLITGYFVDQHPEIEDLVGLMPLRDLIRIVGN